MDLKREWDTKLKNRKWIIQLFTKITIGCVCVCVVARKQNMENYGIVPDVCYIIGVSVWRRRKKGKINRNVRNFRYFVNENEISCSPLKFMICTTLSNDTRNRWKSTEADVIIETNEIVEVACTFISHQRNNNFWIRCLCVLSRHRNWAHAACVSFHLAATYNEINEPQIGTHNNIYETKRSAIFLVLLSSMWHVVSVFVFVHLLLGANNQLPSVSMPIDLFTHVCIVFLFRSSSPLSYSNKSVSLKNFVYDDLIADSDKLWILWAIMDCVLFGPMVKVRQLKCPFLLCVFARFWETVLRQHIKQAIVYVIDSSSRCCLLSRMSEREKWTE